MFIKTLLVYGLSFAVGIGAVTHAKTQLVEQRLQEAAQNEELANRISDAPNQWHRLQWTV